MQLFWKKVLRADTPASPTVVCFVVFTMIAGCTKSSTTAPAAFAAPHCTAKLPSTPPALYSHLPNSDTHLYISQLNCSSASQPCPTVPKPLHQGRSSTQTALHKFSNSSPATIQAATQLYNPTASASSKQKATILVPFPVRLRSL